MSETLIINDKEYKVGTAKEARLLGVKNFHVHSAFPMQQSFSLTKCLLFEDRGKRADYYSDNLGVDHSGTPDEAVVAWKVLAEEIISGVTPANMIDVPEDEMVLAETLAEMQEVMQWTDSTGSITVEEALV